jgi:hypothetical protein
MAHRRTVSGPTTTAEGLAIVVVDGAAVAIVATDNALGVDGAATARSSAHVGVSRADTDVDTGLCGIGSGNEADQGGGKGSE